MEKPNNIKNYESYIGKEMIGFKFDSVISCEYSDLMDDYIGVVGTIIEWDSYYNIFVVEFEELIWCYPADLVIKQLNQKEELTKMMEKDEEAGIYDTDDSEISVDPIVERVCNKFRQRSEVGVRKYNTTLADSTDGMGKFLLHLQEELMDAVNYIEKLKSQVEELKSKLG